jgi:hypothetical protein
LNIENSGLQVPSNKKPARTLRSRLYIIGLLVSLITALSGNAQEKPAASAQELADKLNNPVANMISVPFQNNVDWGIGPHKGSKYTLNFQPVVPIELNPKLNLITRYIIPIVDQHDISGEGESQFGLSDATVSAFFSPAASRNGWIWGAGPAFLVPIGTDDYLSTRKWGMGPTVLALRQVAGVTYGLLTNQIWSFAGDKDRADVNQLYVQPFLAKSWKSGGGIGFNSEITFNWRTNKTTAFLNPVVNGITKLGKQAIQLAVGPRIPLNSSTAFGFRGVIVFVFPK